MASKNARKNTLTFESPADWWGALWRDALPTGNGTVGAAVYGGAGDERILINHAGLSWQGHTGVLPDVGEKVNDVRKLSDAGEFAQAAALLSNSLINRGYRPIPDVPLPLCDILAHHEFERPVKDYSRSVNLDTGEITVSYRDGATRFSRSLFVSRAQDMIVYEITKTGPKNIDMRFSLDLHDRGDARTPVSVTKLPENAAFKYEKYFLYLAARNDNATDFGLVARVSTFGGTVEAVGDGVTVRGAEKILLIAEPFVESNRDKEWKAIRGELALNKLTYDKLLKDHAAAHAKLFGGAALDLGGDTDESIERMIGRARKEGAVPKELYEKLWAYGRYLFVCSTAPTSLVMRPNGLWCGDYKAVDSSVNAAGSVQQAYAHALTGGLSEHVLPLFDKYETMLDDLKKNATRLYNARGIVVPAVTAPQTGLVGSVEPAVVHTTWIAGSLADLMYDYYLYTRDTKFLKNRALPFLREVALFYETFFRTKLDGLYDAVPSYSPDGYALGMTAENTPLAFAASSTLDFAVARRVLSDLIEGAREVKVYENEIEKWKTMKKRIPPYVYKDGMIREFHDIRLTDNFDTGSLAMLYDIYPGNADLERQPDLARAGLATAKKRETAGIRRRTAEACVKLSGVYARLCDGEDALGALDNAVCAFANSNLTLRNFDFLGMGVGAPNAWATSGLTANLGLTAVLQEMLIQSTDSVIRLLPALPKAWKTGSFEGFATRMGVTVDLEWNITKRPCGLLKLKSRRATTADIVMPEGVTKVKEFAFDAATRTLRIDLPANKIITVKF